MLLVGNLLSRGVGMVLIPVYTSVLRPEDLNYWEALLLGSMLASMVAAHGITAALMWTLKTGGRGGRGPLEGEDQQRAVSAAVGWALLSGALICGAAALAAEPLAGLMLDQPGFGRVLALLLGAQTLRVVTYPAEGVLKLRFQSLPFVFMSFGEFLVQLVGSIVALKVLDMGLEGMAWAAFLASSLRFGLGMRYLPEMRRPRLDWTTVRPMVAYGLPLMPGAVASLVLSLSDRWFFNHFGLARDGGIYAYGDKWARLIEMLLVTPLVGMWPAVYFNIAREPDAPQRFGRIATLWLGIGGTAALALTLAGPALTALFDTSEGDQFEGASQAIGVLACGYVVFGLVEVARAGFAITGRTRRTAIAFVSAALVNIVLNATLIPLLGAMGAAWATLIAAGVALGMVLGMSARVFPMAFQWSRLAVTSGLLVGLAWAVDLAAPPAMTVQGSVVRLMVLALVPLALWRGGFLTVEERGALGQGLGRVWQRLRRREG